MSTWILGISAYFHDSSAALVRDGDIIAAASEERFTRIKADASFPALAATYCLEAGNIAVADLDHVVFFEDEALKFSRILENCLHYAPRGISSLDRVLPIWAKQKLRLDEVIPDCLARLQPHGKNSRFKGKLGFVRHHQAHAASAFFPSPFAAAAILTMDAVGEWAASSIGVGEGHRVRLLRTSDFPDSLGMLYSALTYYLGFKVNSGEYKVMGLAPYGRLIYVETIKKNLVSIREDGSITLDLSYFDFRPGARITTPKLHALFGRPPRSSDERLLQFHMDLAASIQAVAEEVVLKAARFARELTNQDNLVLAGGVALNCVANGRLQREGIFKQIWIQPAAGDAGGALGAALFQWHEVLGSPRQCNSRDAQKGSLLGPSFSNAEIGTYLKSMGASSVLIDREEDLLSRVAALLSEGKIVGWFTGRMEFGPRALGSRSILADPRQPNIQHDMNVKVKFRESFRPFAPSVLQEHCHQYFEMAEGSHSPYMLFVSPVHKSVRLPQNESAREQLEDPDLMVRLAVPRSQIQGVTHVDFSARVQTVDEERHGRYYRLIRRFHALTGCSVLMNTSFNLRGEPIVCTPEDAYECFMTTDIDCLVLHDFLLMKHDQPPRLSADIKGYKQSYEKD